MKHCIPIALLIFGATQAFAQNPVEGRWVGTHLNHALHLDFYGDSMVVVNDRFPAGYHASPDSLVVWGDTAFAVSYWFSLDRMLLRTADGNVITMSRQSELARPIQGRWQGSPLGRGDRTIVLQLERGGAARRRTVPVGPWVQGEWDRSSRTIRFMWLPDSTVWTARHDPLGEALLFSETDEETGTLILRKVWR